MGFVALALSGGLWILPAAPAVADTVPCTDSWTGAADNSWFNPANWSASVVPDSTQDVCIGDVKTDTYTVQVDGTLGAATVKSITVGGDSGTQTLALDGATLVAVADSSVSAHGAITLEGSGPAVVNLVGPGVGERGDVECAGGRGP